MRWLRSRLRFHREVPEETESRRARVEAEKKFREAASRWPEVQDVSEALEVARRENGQDPFLEELSRAMRSSRRHHREA